MKKRDLIKALETVDDNEEVFLAFPAGDYLNRTLVVEIRSAEFERTKRSVYFNSLVIAEKNTETDEEDKDVEEVFVIQ